MYSRDCSLIVCCTAAGRPVVSSQFEVNLNLSIIVLIRRKAFTVKVCMASFFFFSVKMLVNSFKIIEIGLACFAGVSTCFCAHDMMRTKCHPKRLLVKNVKVHINFKLRLKPSQV